MAVAGFSPDELDVSVHENVLLVSGKSQKGRRRTSTATCTTVSRGGHSNGASAFPIT
jgi:HSP20 family molecular chaperone IbpA